MRLPGAYRSLPRPSSAPKPSHPTGSVVYQQIFPVPRLESEVYTRLHRELIPAPGNLSLALHSTIVSGRELHWIVVDRANLHDILFLGGDPAAGSPTATLLRLNPPYKAQIRHGQLSTMPHQNLIRVVRRAVCARSRDVFTAG